MPAPQGECRSMEGGIREGVAEEGAGFVGSAYVRGVDQPADNKALKINIRDSGHFQIQSICEARENGAEFPIDFDHLPGAGELTTRDVGQPVARFGNDALGVRVVSMDIHTGDIRDEFLIPIFLGIKDQEALVFLQARAEPFSSHKDSELERHVKPRKVVFI